jgi:cytochrome c556
MNITTKNVRIALGACAASVMLLVGSAQAANEPAALIAYRQATMKAIGGHMGALGAFAKGEVDFVQDVGGHAHAINEMSKGLARLFPKGSGKEAGETRALPKIWEDWAGFEAAIKTLSDQSAKLAIG